MKKSFKGIFTVLILVMVMLLVAIPVLAAGETGAEEDATISTETTTEEVKDNTVVNKAWAAAIVVGVVAAAGAISMGWSITKSAEGISRQPEAEGSIRTSLMLGLIFVETAIIYALIIAILIIFVL